MKPDDDRRIAERRATDGAAKLRRRIESRDGAMTMKGSAALANMRSAAETFRCACSGYIGAITNEETVRTAARDRETSEEIDKLRRAVAKESMRDQVALAAGLDDAGIEKVP